MYRTLQGELFFRTNFTCTKGIPHILENLKPANDAFSADKAGSTNNTED